MPRLEEDAAVVLALLALNVVGVDDVISRCTQHAPHSSREEEEEEEKKRKEKESGK